MAVKRTNWGFAIKRSKKAAFICVTKDSAADNFTAADFEYLETLFQGKASSVSSGVHYFPLEFDIEKVLLDAGFEKDEQQATKVLDYMKEEGYLKSYR